MTGATVIARHGNNFYMVKVRSDGSDVVDYLPQVVACNLPPQAALEKYLQLHLNGMDQFSISCQLDENIQFAVYFSQLSNLPKKLSDIAHYAESEMTHQLSHLNEGDPFFGYSCGYCDYVAIIDYANNGQILMINGRKIRT